MEAHWRVSDHERQQVIDVLTRHIAAGRLALEEFSDRAAMAYRSKTVADLAAITTDLPGHSLADAVRRPAPVVAASMLVLLVLLGAVLLVAGSGWAHMDTMMASMSMATGCR